MTLALKFKEGQALRLFDAPVDLAGNALVQSMVTSWSLRVFDLDTVTGKVDSPVYELLGQDPAGTNTGPGTLPFFATAATTGNGWTKDRTGYTFVLDLDTTLFPHSGGHKYRFELVYSTWLSGDRKTEILGTCQGQQGDN